MNNRLTDWLKSRQGEDFKLMLDFVIAIMVFFWLLKNHKIIKK